MLFFIKVVWLIFHPFQSDAHQEKHFLHYKFTALTKADTFPEFSAEVVVDDRRIKHFSDEERVWIRTEGDQIEAPADPPESRNWFLHQIRTLSNCTDSQCSELHVLQRLTGCKLEKHPDGSVNLTVFDEYGLDGEDFISFNSDTTQWIDKNPKAKESKRKWDNQTVRNQFINDFLKNCTDWISTYNNTKQNGSSFAGETESRWCFTAGVAAAAAAGLVLLSWICVNVQKAETQNVVEIMNPGAHPDAEQAAVDLCKYETGVALLQL